MAAARMNINGNNLSIPRPRRQKQAPVTVMDKESYGPAIPPRSKSAPEDGGGGKGDVVEQIHQGKKVQDLVVTDGGGGRDSTDEDLRKVPLIAVVVAAATLYCC